jgi:hypothetical protein
LRFNIFKLKTFSEAKNFLVDYAGEANSLLKSSFLEVFKALGQGEYEFPNKINLYSNAGEKNCSELCRRVCF